MLVFTSLLLLFSRLAALTKGVAPLASLSRGSSGRLVLASGASTKSALRQVSQQRVTRRPGQMGANSEGQVFMVSLSRRVLALAKCCT